MREVWVVSSHKVKIAHAYLSSDYRPHSAFTGEVSAAMKPDKELLWVFVPADSCQDMRTHANAYKVYIYDISSILPSHLPCRIGIACGKKH